MLRRKLMLVMGSVLALLLVAGVAAILLLQDVLGDLDRLRDDALAGATMATTIQVRLSDSQSILEKRGRFDDADVQVLRNAQSDISACMDRLIQLNPADVQLKAAAESFSARLARWRGSVDAAVGDDFAVGASMPRREALAAVAALRDALDRVNSAYRSHSAALQISATTKLRWVALSLGIAFLLIINLSTMALSRMTSMVVKPVDALVEASRRLACEDFDCRVELDRRDEFGELARAYNNLAAQLQANEERKLETLHQVARTLNHELNNAIAIIQLQLGLVARSAGSDGKSGILAERLREIQQALSRMAGIVASLTRVRRIVLTDYLSGVKMLDLERSVDAEPAQPEPSPRREEQPPASAA